MNTEWNGGMRRAGLALPGALVMLGLLGGFEAFALPRMPEPPWPEAGLLTRLRFDEPFRASANQAVDTSFYAESWSGYALRRSGYYVQPLVVPMLSSNTASSIDPERGAIRLWFRGDWSSLSTGLGAGPGHPASLLALAATNGGGSAVFWSLQFSADGNALQMVCQTEAGPAVCLSAPVSFQAGSWHLLALGYTETNSALFIDGQEVATGDGLMPVPVSAAPFTSLAVGSSFAGDQVVCGQIDEVSIFSGSKGTFRTTLQPFGLDVDWEISYYYSRFSQVAALGPVTDAELAAQAQARAASLSTIRASASMSTMALDGGGSTFTFDGTSGCGTGGPCYFTNFTCFFDSAAGWTVSFGIAGGASGTPYEICMTTNLAPTDSTGHAQWSWLGRGSACGLYTFTGQPGPNAFYILGDSTVDPDGDGLSTPLETLVFHTPPNSYTTLPSDGYGTPALWYIQHGLNPLTPGIATQDADGDGIVNWQEYRMGTDPASADGFGIWVASPSGFSGIP